MLLQIAGLAGEPGLVHAFSTLAMGSMRYTGPGAGALTPERELLLRSAGLEAPRLTVAGAVHGVAVVRVDAPAGVLRGADGLVTDRPGLPLLATFADCYAVLLYDPVRPALALAHAGWRGTAAGIACRAVRALGQEYGSRPEDLLAGLGPGICCRCYEVGQEVAARFDGELLTATAGGRYRLDLAEANQRQLELAGVRPERIHRHGGCTRESAVLPSHRRLADGARFACVVAIR